MPVPPSSRHAASSPPLDADDSPAPFPAHTLEVERGGWSPGHSARLYGVRGWGAGFFDVNEAGEAVVSLPVDPSDGERVMVSLPQLVRRLEDEEGVRLPVLLRFPQILEARIRDLNESFRRALADHGFKGGYRGVFPVKVNQQSQVIDEVTRFGRRFHHGLEVGSKPELVAALAHLHDPEALLVCNGYKDRAFIDLALRATKLGLNVILVVEMPHEVDMIGERSEALGIEPNIGIRVKLAVRGSGHWTDSGGEQSPFGVNLGQLIEIVDRLRRERHLHWLRMLHSHQGSQIPELETIRNASREAARIYAELVHEGAPMGLLNLGGGLAVDYEGAASVCASSTTYSMAEYAAAVVSEVVAVLDGEDVAHPTLVTESGRAIAAHYSMLLMKVLDVNRFKNPEDPSRLMARVPAPLREAAATAARHDPADPEGSYRRLVAFRDAVRDAFHDGRIGLRDRARAESLVWSLLTRIAAEATAAAAGSEEEHSSVLSEIEGLLADRYYANFSIFQSTPDAWAIGQLFPVMPIQRLDEEPERPAVINDVTCDCDGKIKRYAIDGAEQGAVPLHELSRDEDYVIGIFLVGAYQETLSDLHNLFGDTHAVSIEAGPGGPEVTQQVHGDTVAQVLEYMEHTPEDLARGFEQLVRAAAAAGRLPASEVLPMLDVFREQLASYTYFDA